MKNNAYEFRNLLEEGNIMFTEKEGLNENNETIFLIDQHLDCGVNIRIGVIFNNDDTMVHIYLVNYVILNNPSKKQYLYELVNDINKNYNLVKFTISEKNSVDCEAHIIVDNNFKPMIVMNYICNIIKVMDDNYGDFMKLIWS